MMEVIILVISVGKLDGGGAQGSLMDGTRQCAESVLYFDLDQWLCDYI